MQSQLLSNIKNPGKKNNLNVKVIGNFQISIEKEEVKGFDVGHPQGNWDHLVIRHCNNSNLSGF